MRKPKFFKTSLIVNDGYEGISIEETCRQAITGNSIDTGTRPQIFTLRKDGVRPEYDMRTDKFKIAQTAMGKAANKYLEQRKINLATYGKQTGTEENE